MFGYVKANWQTLTEAQQHRYTAAYCGICRGIREQSSELARLTLQYDMAFLALLLMSLYEPEEVSGEKRCAAHLMKKRPWVDNAYVRYAADMNVALAYYKAQDDVRDDGSLAARALSGSLRKHYARIREQWPRQCAAIEECIRALNEAEASGTDNPDVPAGLFGKLMGELLVYREDLWAESLRGMGFQLGRFLYLVDAMIDYEKDLRSGSYNPFRASRKNRAQWEQYLLLAIGKCTEYYEKLPLVQDKPLLDNILYSGVWVQYRTQERKEDHHGEGSL